MKRKTQLIYIGLSILSFVLAVLVMKIPGANNISAKEKIKNPKEQENSEIYETNNPLVVKKTKKVDDKETLKKDLYSVETEESPETMPVIDSNFEIIKIGDKKYEFSRDSGNSVINQGDIDYNNLVDFSADYPFYIKVNRALNCVTVYAMDKEGEYSIPYKTMTCSTGLFKNNTPLGDFEIYEKYDWRMMIDDSYAQYASRFNGGIMFHSVPYLDMDKGMLEWEEYNKLGSAASLGCVRLRVVDAKWIYDHCAEGTKVTVYDDEKNPGPLGKEILDAIDEDSEFKGWDPTDDDENNPWNKPKKKKKRKKHKKNKKKKTNIESESSTELSSETESVTEESTYGSTAE